MANYYATQGSARFLKASSILSTGGSTAVTYLSTAFSAQTRQIRVVTNITGGVFLVTADSTANTGVSPTVSSSAAMFIAANNFPEYFTVSPGQIVAVSSTTTSTGVISITEMTN